MTAGELTSFLHRSIPLTRALAVQVTYAVPGCVRIAAPLAPNLNHHGTAFGGSLATLGILAGWSVLHHGLTEAGIDAALVVQRSELEYLQPVTADFFAESELPESWGEFVDALRAGRRARIAIGSRLLCNGVEAVRLQGVYAALPRVR